LWVNGESLNAHFILHKNNDEKIFDMISSGGGETKRITLRHSIKCQRTIFEKASVLARIRKDIKKNYDKMYELN